MQITAVAATCGQMAAALGLLCIANILAQWAVSTPRHSIHRRWQAELQAGRQGCRHRGALLPEDRALSLFLHYFEALPLDLNPRGKIPSRESFMIQRKSGSQCCFQNT